MKNAGFSTKALLLAAAVAFVPTLGLVGCGGEEAAPVTTEGMNPDLQQSLEATSAASDEVAQEPPAETPAP